MNVILGTNITEVSFQPSKITSLQIIKFVELSKEIFHFKWEKSSALKAFPHLLLPLIWRGC